MERPILPKRAFLELSGERLRDLIRLLGITQVEAGRLMGVSKNVLHHWLVGNHPIDPYALYRLCRTKNVDFNYVFLGDWTALPHPVAKAIEDRALATPAAPQEPAPPQDGTKDEP